MKLHHDNARPHVKDIVIDYLHGQKIKLIHHPPYSPDLAPCYFWLFGYLKTRLESYSDPSSLTKAVTKELNSIPLDEYRETFHKWMERMKICIENQGHYFPCPRFLIKTDGYRRLIEKPSVKIGFSFYTLVFTDFSAISVLNLMKMFVFIKRIGL